MVWDPLPIDVQYAVLLSKRRKCGVDSSFLSLFLQISASNLPLFSGFGVLSLNIRFKYVGKRFLGDGNTYSLPSTEFISSFMCFYILSASVLYVFVYIIKDTSIRYMGRHFINIFLQHFLMNYLHQNFSSGSLTSDKVNYNTYSLFEANICAQEG